MSVRPTSQPPRGRRITPAEREGIRQILTRNGRGPDDLMVVDGPLLGLTSAGSMVVGVHGSGKQVGTIRVTGWDDDWLLDFEKRLRAGDFD